MYVYPYKGQMPGMPQAYDYIAIFIDALTTTRESRTVWLAR